MTKRFALQASCVKYGDQRQKGDRVIKTALFHLFSRLVTSYRGKRLLEDTLSPAFGQPRFTADTPPFPLSPAPRATTVEEIPATLSKTPVFITARFRSGSSFLWHLFNHCENVTAYYEPLNERRWFLSSETGRDVDPTHRGVSSYGLSYDGMADLASLFDDGWGSVRLFMDAAAHDARLETYINALIDRSQGQPVLQFNRMDFRLDWLKSRFPTAKIIHLTRDPRDQWISMLGPDSGCTPETSLKAFAPYDRFYLKTWARDLVRVFPFLALDDSDSPYLLHYLIWRLSDSAGRAFSDLSLTFEALVGSPEKTLGLISKTTGTVLDYASLRPLFIPPDTEKWKRFAEENWFANLEARGERLLAAAYGKPYG